VAEHLRRERLAELERDVSFPQQAKHGVVVHRIHDRDDVLEVLGRGPEHRRPSDVDVLDGVFEGRGGSGDGGQEGVEIDCHQMKPGDPVGFELHPVTLDVRAGEQAGVNRGMQRLHPPVENLRESGDPIHRGDGDVRFAERRGCSARRDQLPAELDQAAGEFDDATLVAYRDQSTAIGHEGCRPGGEGQVAA